MLPQLLSVPRALGEGDLVSHQAITACGLLAPLGQQRDHSCVFLSHHLFSIDPLPCFQDKAQLLGLAFKVPCVLTTHL